MNPEVPVLWAAAIATLGVYTILYRENPISRLFEHVFVGLAAGYLILVTWTQNLEAKWWAPMVHQGRWQWIFAPVIGLLFYFIYSRRLLWMARLVMGLVFGTAAGYTFRQFFPINAPQITASFKPLRPDLPVHGRQALDAWGYVILHHWVFAIILFTVLSYFFFSVPHEGRLGRVLGRSSMAGRWFLMIAFGAMFGNTVMARLSLFIGRMQFLLFAWLGHYLPWLAGRG
jgi:hypothetical protein